MLPVEGVHIASFVRQVNNEDIRKDTQFEPEHDQIINWYTVSLSNVCSGLHTACLHIIMRYFRPRCFKFISGAHPTAWSVRVYSALSANRSNMSSLNRGDESIRTTTYGSNASLYVTCNMTSYNTSTIRHDST